jgi:hypothetical protein
MKLGLSLLLISFPYLINAQTDTTYQKAKSTTIYRISFAGTYSAQQNWYNDENNYKSIALLFNNDITHKVYSDKIKQNYSFRCNLGYLKILDSIWIKNNDYWRMSAVVIENQNKWLTHTYTITARSQFLNTYRYIYQSEIDETSKVKTATFFNPATITIAYGMSYSFWEDNFINFNFAAVNFNTKPRFGGFQKSNDHELAKTKNMYMYADYGLNIQININKAINPYTQWENNSYFFANGINKQQINLDFSNRITFKFLKFLQFRVDSHILYDALYSTRLQYQLDFTIGLFMEKRTKRFQNQP